MRNSLRILSLFAVSLSIASAYGTPTVATEYIPPTTPETPVIFKRVPNPSTDDDATNATFSSSTSLSGGGLSVLHDGVITTSGDDPNNSSYADGTDYTITITFPTAQPIYEVDTYSHHDNTTDLGGGLRAGQKYTLSGSADGTNFADIQGAVVNTNGGNSLGGAWGVSVRGYLGTFKAIRLNVQRQNNQFGTFFSEIDVWTTPQPIVISENIPPGNGTDFSQTDIPVPSNSDPGQTATITASTANFGSAGTLTDGTIGSDADDVSQGYIVEGQTGDVQFDFGTARPITEVNVYSRHENSGEPGGGSRANQKFRIFGSNDGNSWDPLSPLVNTNNGNLQGGCWGTTVRGYMGDYRYVKIEVYPPSASGFGTMYREMDVVTGVKPSGLDPTGASDNKSAIQSAIDGLGSGGGTIALDAGTYKVTLPDQLYINVPSNVTIAGKGNDTNLAFDGTGTYHQGFKINGSNIRLDNLTATRATGLIIVMVYLEPSANNFRMTRTQIDGNWGSGDGSSVYAHGMEFATTGASAPGSISNTTIDDCDILKLNYGLFMRGTSPSDPDSSRTNVTNTSVKYSRFQYNNADDLAFNAPAGSWSYIDVRESEFHNNNASGVGSGFGVDGANAQHLSVTNCRFWDISHESVHIEDRSANFEVTDNYFTRGADFGPFGPGSIHILTGSHDGTVSGNQFYLSDVAVANNAIYIADGTPTDGTSNGVPWNITISDNYFYLGTVMNGVGIEGGNHSTIDISGNLFLGGGTVTNNVYSGGINYAVYLVSTRGVNVTDNTIQSVERGLATRIANPDPFPYPCDGNSIITGNDVNFCRYQLDSRPSDMTIPQDIGTITLSPNSYFMVPNQ
jgi:Right handed beta helix region